MNREVTRKHFFEKTLEKSIMKLKKYLKTLLEERPYFEIKNLYDKYKNLDLELWASDFHEWQSYLLQYDETGKVEFEMCGPRVLKKEAMRMAACYNWPKIEGVFGPICCYNSSLHRPNNYGVFKLNGAIGLNGSTWECTTRLDALEGVLDLILNDPNFEFAVFFAQPYHEKTVQQEKALSQEFTTRIADVRYGFQYDPKQKQLKILKPRAAWKAVRSYQALYTKEERLLFSPWESDRYYTQDPKGRADLAEFVDFEKASALRPNVTMALMPLDQYLERIEEPWGVDNPTNDMLIEIHRDPNLAALGLKAYIENPAFLKLIWMLQTVDAEYPYFEMCGPKISQQKAMEMAADYQWDTTRHSTFGRIVCYDSDERSSNNYGLFQLDGLVGLNGVCNRFVSRRQLVCTVLELIICYPEFEFAAAFSRWSKIPPTELAEQEFLEYSGCILWNTEDDNMQPCDVEFGLSYDPAQKLFKILGPQSAWEEVKRYQTLYTKEERSRFTPETSSLYYKNDPIGKKALADFIEYQKSYRYPPKRIGSLKVQEYAELFIKESARQARKCGSKMKLEQALKSERVAEVYAEYRRYEQCEKFLNCCKWKYNLLDLTISFEYPQYESLSWLLQCEKTERAYFEMCGPRISQERARKLAKAYNTPDECKEMIGTISCYGLEGVLKRNYALFHLDGRVGLNGVLGIWAEEKSFAALHCNMLLFLIELIHTDPQLEFAIMVTKWNEMPERYQELPAEEIPSTCQFLPQPKDVSYGAVYDPKRKRLKILGPSSAWKTVKNYQNQYSEEQCQIFDPTESRKYYETDPKGRHQLEQFLKKPMPNTIVSAMPLHVYLKNVFRQAKHSSGNQLMWFYEDWLEQYGQLDLKLLFDEPQMMSQKWLEQLNDFGRWPNRETPLCFEICGPRISPQQAVQMAAEYNEPTIHSAFGEMSHYDRKNGSGVFRLDGCVGQIAVPLKAKENYEVMDALFDLIKSYPDFEFAMLILKSTNKRITKEKTACCKPNSVEYGAWYDPSRKLLSILGPRAACQMVKKYREQYTKKELCLFKKEASEQYYSQDPPGKKELAKFIAYLQEVYKKQ